MASASSPNAAGSSLPRADEKELRPTGVLSIHIKRCRNLRLVEALKDFSKQCPVSIYFKLQVADSLKISTVNNCKYSNKAGMVLDDLKHFLLEVSNSLDDSSNKVRIIMMGFQGHEHHKKIGEKDIHLFNIIKNQYIVETVDFTQNAHIIGEVEMEFAFSYGCFGYGYSPQLQNTLRMPTEQVQHSLLFRAPIPQDRDMEGRHTLASGSTHHLPFINWTAKVDLVGTADRSPHGAQGNLVRKPSDYPLLTQRIRDRFFGIGDKLSGGSMDGIGRKSVRGSKDSLHISNVANQINMEGMPPGAKPSIVITNWTRDDGSNSTKLTPDQEAAAPTNLPFEPQHSLQPMDKKVSRKGLFTKIMNTIGFTSALHDRPSALAMLKEVPKITLTPAPPMTASSEDLTVNHQSRTSDKKEA